jgi:hypothetical protein
MKMHENYIEPYQGSFYENYLGVDIDKDGNTYISFVWSEKKQKTVELHFFNVEVLRTELDEILAYNFFQSLKEISEKFGATKDFNHPEQNLDNVLMALNKRLKNFIYEI